MTRLSTIESLRPTAHVVRPSRVLDLNLADRLRPPSLAPSGLRVARYQTEGGRIVELRLEPTSHTIARRRAGIRAFEQAPAVLAVVTKDLGGLVDSLHAALREISARNHPTEIATSATLVDPGRVL